MYPSVVCPPCVAWHSIVSSLARVNSNLNFKFKFKFKFSMRKLSLPVHSSEMEDVLKYLCGVSWCGAMLLLDEVDD